MNYSIKTTDTEKYINAVKEYNYGKKRLALVITLGCQQNEADIRALLPRQDAFYHSYTLLQHLYIFRYR